MPTCLRCQRRVWFWEADLLGRSCARCREEEAQAMGATLREELAACQSTVREAGVARRVCWGVGRGALFGTLGLGVVGLSLLGLLGGPGVRYPFRDQPLVWVIVHLGAVALAALVGWWFSSWLLGILCLLATGAVGGAIIGGYRGLCPGSQYPLPRQPSPATEPRTAVPG